MKKLGLKLLFVIGVVLGAIVLTIKNPTKLGLDLKGGVYVVLQAKPAKGETLDKDAINRLIEVLDRRINSLGIAEPVVQQAGNDRVIIELAGVNNTNDAIHMIGKTALLEFKIKNPDGTYGPTLLTGKSLKSAKASRDNLNRPQIQFEMNDDGAFKFANITRDNIGKQLAILLDGEEQTAPNINSEILGGSGVITGSYTEEDAKKLANLLNAGALPVDAEIIETRTIGASLGDESIVQSKNAGIVAMSLIGVFMILFYRLPGFIANIALLIFSIITLGILNFFGATLTLPGIAGFILSVGMAVDANVIIFERIKEELQTGNTILNSIQMGFNKGFVAIFDSNLTTLIITTILFTFGTGPVKGFAVTLTIGTLASMFTAITVTKILLTSVVRLFNIKNPKLFGVKEKTICK